MRVLVAEDETKVAEARRARPAARGHGGGRGAATARTRCYKARLHRHDVVVLDRDLPEVHGDEVCRAISGELPATKVLMLTGSTGVDDLVDGLALGADDYMGKPFAFAELVARVRALGPARRRGAAGGAASGRHRAGPRAPHGHARGPRPGR